MAGPGDAQAGDRCRGQLSTQRFSTCVPVRFPRFFHTYIDIFRADAWGGSVFFVLFFTYDAFGGRFFFRSDGCADAIMLFVRFETDSDCSIYARKVSVRMEM